MSPTTSAASRRKSGEASTRTRPLSSASIGSAVAQVLLDHQHARAGALKVDDARAHDAAVERHLDRSAAARRRDVVEDVFVECRNLHQHAPPRLVPVKGDESVAPLQPAGAVGETGGRCLLCEGVRRRQYQEEQKNG